MLEPDIRKGVNTLIYYPKTEQSLRWKRCNLKTDTGPSVCNCNQKTNLPLPRAFFCRDADILLELCPHVISELLLLFFFFTRQETGSPFITFCFHLASVFHPCSPTPPPFFPLDKSSLVRTPCLPVQSNLRTKGIL